MSLVGKTPKDLDEAVDLIIQEINAQPGAQEHVKKNGISHHGTGTNIRNSLGLWWNEINNVGREPHPNKPPLVQWFNDRDIFIGDDLSMIIINAVKAKVRNLEYDINDDIKKIKQHWAQHGFADGIYTPGKRP